MSKVLRKVRRFWLNDMEAIACIMFILIIIGTINISSASLITAYTNFDSPYYFLRRHLYGLAAGTALFFIVSRFFDYRRLRRLGCIIPMLAVIIVLLIAVLFVGIEVNGSRRWLPLPVLQFQPSELAKFVSIIISAYYLSFCLDKNITITINPRKNIIFVICIILFLLVELEKDMGTALIIFGIPVIMYVVAGLPGKIIKILSVVGTIGLGAVATFQPYRVARIKNWLDPWSDAQGDGYQVIQSILSIGSGQLTGMGLGHGYSKYSYLPEAHTDFAFAVYCQETGFIGAMIVFILFLALAFYCVKIAIRTRDNFGKMLVIGFTLLITCQAAGNLAMINSLLPVVGVPLPFISYGGTSLLLNMLSVAIIISVGRRASLANTPPQTKSAGTIEHKTYTTKSGKTTNLRRIK